VLFGSSILSSTTQTETESQTVSDTSEAAVSSPKATASPSPKATASAPEAPAAAASPSPEPADAKTESNGKATSESEAPAEANSAASASSQGQQNQQNQGGGQGDGPSRPSRNRSQGRGKSRSNNKQQNPDIPRSSEPMNLTDLKTKSTQELIDIAATIGLDNLARSRKQDIIFSILKRHAKSGEDIYGDGVLEILQDGFGFLRSADSSYLAGPDDIYVSPSQIRRFNLRTGDTITGKIRPPKDSERYFALLKIGEVNFSRPENSKSKILFENLTPLFPDERLTLEKGNGSTEDLTGRIMDLVAPIGKGQRGLLVAPPKAGKTIMMQNIAQAILTNNPETYMIVLLIDERPEEVTEMQRSVGIRGAEVVASTFDEPPHGTYRLPIWSSRKPNV